MNATVMPPRVVKPRLVIDAVLYPRLLSLAESARKRLPEVADQLLEEIERADLRPPHEMPEDVVTLGSEVTFHDGERTETVQVVAPVDADIDQRRISILTPVGAALFGLTAGQRIAWPMPHGRVKVLEVVAVQRANEAAAAH
jgi:regulator of nucleoside diphosphate kinase